MTEISDNRFIPMGVQLPQASAGPKGQDNETRFPDVNCAREALKNNESSKKPLSFSKRVHSLCRQIGGWFKSLGKPKVEPHKQLYDIQERATAPVTHTSSRSVESIAQPTYKPVEAQLMQVVGSSIVAASKVASSQPPLAPSLNHQMKERETLQKLLQESNLKVCSNESDARNHLTSNFGVALFFEGGSVRLLEKEGDTLKTSEAMSITDAVSLLQDASLTPKDRKVIIEAMLKIPTDEERKTVLEQANLLKAELFKSAKSPSITLAGAVVVLCKVDAQNRGKFVDLAPEVFKGASKVNDWSLLPIQENFKAFSEIVDFALPVILELEKGFERTPILEKLAEIQGTVEDKKQVADLVLDLAKINADGHVLKSIIVYLGQIPQNERKSAVECAQNALKDSANLKQLRDVLSAAAQIKFPAIGEAITLTLDLFGDIQSINVLEPFLKLIGNTPPEERGKLVEFAKRYREEHSPDTADLLVVLRAIKTIPQKGDNPDATFTLALELAKDAPKTLHAVIIETVAAVSAHRENAIQLAKEVVKSTPDIVLFLSVLKAIGAISDERQRSKVVADASALFGMVSDYQKGSIIHALSALPEGIQRNKVIQLSISLLQKGNAIDFPAAVIRAMGGIKQDMLGTMNAAFPLIKGGSNRFQAEIITILGKISSSDERKKIADILSGLFKDVVDEGYKVSIAKTLEKLSPSERDEIAKLAPFMFKDAKSDKEKAKIIAELSEISSAKRNQLFARFTTDARFTAQQAREQILYPQLINDLQKILNSVSTSSIQSNLKALYDRSDKVEFAAAVRALFKINMKHEAKDFLRNFLKAEFPQHDAKDPNTTTDRVGERFVTYNQSGRMMGIKGITLLVDFLKAKGAITLPTTVCMQDPGLYDKIDELLKETSPEKFPQIILVKAKDGVHITPIFCDRNKKGKLQLILTDSTGAYTGYVGNIMSELTSGGEGKIDFHFLNDKRQNDPQSCSIFSLTDAIAFCKHQKRLLDIAEQSESDTFEVLPLDFMKSSQSLSAIQKVVSGGKRGEIEQRLKSYPSEKPSLMENLRLIDAFRPTDAELKEFNRKLDKYREKVLVKGELKEQNKMIERKGEKFEGILWQGIILQQAQATPVA